MLGDLPGDLIVVCIVLYFAISIITCTSMNLYSLNIITILCILNCLLMLSIYTFGAYMYWLYTVSHLEDYIVETCISYPPLP